MGKAKYQLEVANDTALGGHHASIALNLLEEIPKTVARYRSICAMHNGGVGFDIRQLPDDYKG